MHSSHFPGLCQEHLEPDGSITDTYMLMDTKMDTDKHTDMNTDRDRKMNRGKENEQGQGN